MFSSKFDIFLDTNRICMFATTSEDLLTDAFVFVVRIAIFASALFNYLQPSIRSIRVATVSGAGVLVPMFMTVKIKQMALEYRKYKEMQAAAGGGVEKPGEKRSKERGKKKAKAREEKTQAINDNDIRKESNIDNGDVDFDIKSDEKKSEGSDKFDESERNAANDASDNDGGDDDDDDDQQPTQHDIDQDMHHNDCHHHHDSDRPDLDCHNDDNSCKSNNGSDDITGRRTNLRMLDRIEKFLEDRGRKCKHASALKEVIRKKRVEVGDFEDAGMQSVSSEETKKNEINDGPKEVSIESSREIAHC